MKNLKLKYAMWLLTLLVLTAFSSFGKNPPDSTNRYSIKQSQHCFDEQKSLGIIIYAQDTIIQKQEQKIKNLELLSDTLFTSNKKITKINNALKSNNTTLKTYLKILGGIGLVELLVIILK